MDSLMVFSYYDYTVYWLEYRITDSGTYTY